MLRTLQDTSSRSDAADGDEANYLELELNTLLKTDLKIWRFLQAGSLDGVWYWDLENPENEWISPEFWSLLGIDPATKRSDPTEWQRLIFPEDMETARDNLEKHCEDPDHRYDQIVRYWHTDGSVVWVRCRGMAVRDTTGKPIRLLGAHTDITKIKQAELLAEKKLAMAEAANADLKTFSYAVSHDLKAPANTLKFLLSELEHQSKGVLDSDSRYLLAQSLETVDRMRDLIEYVLEFTEIAGSVPEYTSVDLTEVARAAVKNLQADIDGAEAQVRMGRLPRVAAAPMQMQILLQNLISNAIKYRYKDRAPRIHITGGVDPIQGEITVQVSDNGMGIAAENQDRIFGLFQRLHTAKEIPGNGIGLSLCRRIALNHGGLLDLESEIEKGTTVILRLPKERAE